MALTLISPENSFVRFGEAVPTHCVWGDLDYCLPVFLTSDVEFQFVIQGTEQEIESLCTPNATEIEVSLVPECDGVPLLTFSEKPQRQRLSATQILYYWYHGFPEFTSVIDVNQCFKVQVSVTEGAYSESVVWCSNCFERVGTDCFTSVLEYGNNEDAFGFKYCYGGDVEGEAIGETCEPTQIPFIGLSSIAIPYTAGLQSKYGNFPSVQVWIYDGLGQLVNMGIQVAFDQYPPTMINIDFGGTSSGLIVIR